MDIKKHLDQLKKDVEAAEKFLKELPMVDSFEEVYFAGGGQAYTFIWSIGNHRLHFAENPGNKLDEFDVIRPLVERSLSSRFLGYKLLPDFIRKCIASQEFCLKDMNFEEIQDELYRIMAK